MDIWPQTNLQLNKENFICQKTVFNGYQQKEKKEQKIVIRLAMVLSVQDADAFRNYLLDFVKIVEDTSMVNL